MDRSIVSLPISCDLHDRLRRLKKVSGIPFTRVIGEGLVDRVADWEARLGLVSDPHVEARATDEGAP